MLAELIIAAEEAPNPLIPAWYDIVYSLVPFLLLLLLFWRVVLPRMQKMLDERAALIEGENSGVFDGDPFASVRAELGLM